MGNYRLVLAYDGTEYHGWQRQPSLPTVQGALEEALAQVASRESPVYAAGRTDAGVHARGQVVNFHGIIKPPAAALPAALNALLPRDVVVRSCEKVAEGFHARRSALSREYRYYIDRGRHPSPFGRRYSLHCPGELDEGAMAEALCAVEGTHDFAAFSRREAGRSRVREVRETEVTAHGHMLTIRVKANAFAWMMMRMLCGSLLEVGRGRWSVERFRRVMEGGDNAASGPALPPRGLFLERVSYGAGESRGGGEF
jgi:tRNA pseudouridine38-40 synthase